MPQKIHGNTEGIRNTPPVAASLITGIDHGERSYKVSLAPPCGQSYARDIAKKYGVTYAQLKERMKKNK